MENYQHFMIRLNSVQDVEDFVSMATAHPFPISLEDGQHCVNGKSFMELFCLVLTRPLKVLAQCDADAFAQLQADAARFRIL